jgi:SAM-dependent methyltransferase
MFDTLEEVVQFYKNPANAEKRHEIIYHEFESNVRVKQPKLAEAFAATEGFGELPFCWNWLLAVQAAPRTFSFLEIGVYKGRVLAMIQLLAEAMGKLPLIVGVSPLSDTGDKYSSYEKVDYVEAIRESFRRTHGANPANTQVVKGFSQDAETVKNAAAFGPFDILFIDGCHDYDIVCKDIENYLPHLKPGGLLVMDDASLLIDRPYGLFHGHPDVARAIHDKLDGRTDIQHLYAVGHNRVWKKLGTPNF